MSDKEPSGPPEREDWPARDNEAPHILVGLPVLLIGVCLLFLAALIATPIHWVLKKLFPGKFKDHV